MSENIDFVIAWVDGNDPNWRKDKEKYDSNGTQSDSDDVRFRDWELLKYWFRGVEKYAPWVNKIHFVTWGHIPNWLNTNNPKLNIVKHEDYIPKEYLPTFSSHVIELNFHRIKDLSENFVYFNDDMFFNNKVKSTEFFKNGIPCDSSVLNVHCAQKSNNIHEISNNDIGVINDHFNFRKCIKENLFKYFNFKYGIKYNLQNLALIGCPRFPGFKQFHICNNFLKSTYEEVWKNEFEVLNETCQNKFRTKNDVNQWIMREWQIASNKYVVTNFCKIGKQISLNELQKPIDKVVLDIKKELFGNKYKIICINDSPSLKDFEKIKKELIDIFEKKFPDKCSFEK